MSLYHDAYREIHEHPTPLTMTPIGTATAECRRAGTGLYRTVYALDANHVLKLATNAFDLSIQSNKREVTQWYEAVVTGDELAAWLCPIVAWAEDYTWLIMRRATGITEHNCYELPEPVRNRLLDLHSGNIGVLDGHVVVIDYGGC